MISRSKVVQSVYDATWGKWVFAGAYDRFLRNAEKAGLAQQRQKIISRAAGRTLELATGTGLNLPHYGSAVTELVLTEPYPAMVAKLDRKVKSLKRPATIVEAYAESIPYPDESFDTVVGTMILCSAEDPGVVLAEVARLLRKGGQYLFLEHVRNPDPKIARRQDRIQPGWYLFGNGCHCNRDAVATIKKSPLKLEELNEGHIPRAWSIVEAMVSGRAVRPSVEPAGCSADACTCT